jgi:Protein of unknown function (DUF2752)
MEEDWRSATSGLMKLRTITGLVAVALLGILAVVYRFAPADHSFYPRCMFYATTQWLCPGCGSTRALHALLHLDVRSALHYNALFTVVAPVVFTWLGFCFYRVMRYEQFPRFTVPRRLAACAITVVLLFTIARNTIFSF